MPTEATWQATRVQNFKPSMRGASGTSALWIPAVPSWVQIENTYVRQARRTINGTRITEEAGQVADLFDATKIISPDRPE